MGKEYARIYRDLQNDYTELAVNRRGSERKREVYADFNRRNRRHLVASPFFRMVHTLFHTSKNDEEKKKINAKNIGTFLPVFCSLHLFLCPAFMGNVCIMDYIPRYPDNWNHCINSSSQV